jgi:cardiolipin synthase
MIWGLGIAALVILGFLLFLILFEPGLRYDVCAPNGVPLGSDHYLALLGALADAQIHGRSKIEVLDNGDKFYDAELEAIRAAKTSVHLEAYIFYKGEVARRFLDAMAERARAGVAVKVVLDAIGSFSTHDSLFEELRKAGGKVSWYQPIRWYTFKRFNNRTHREVLVIDGTVGFIGGAGIADFWFKDDGKQPQWRDTVFRVTGDLVIGLQTTFAENWLESAEQILASPDNFPYCQRLPEDRDEQAPGPGGARGLVVISSPSAGRGTRARVVFQTLLASATKTIDINSPYFLPDRSTRDELIRAVRERGVRVRVITPGKHADHAMTRRSSRRRYGELLKGGVQISEYQPSMIHVKLLVVDGEWTVFGSTNFDNRSFGINDEVNVAAQCRDLADRATQDFERDLAKSNAISYEEWKRRPWTEKLAELPGRLLERQQ